MTTTTTRNLAREVAEALGWERNGELWFYHLQPNDAGYYREDLPDWEHDLNACARDLAWEGYKFHAEQLADNLWTGYYTEDGKPFARLIGWNRSDKLAVAWCEAFLALCKHVDGQGGEGR